VTPALHHQTAARPWRVDFSLALHNRSGKYQIGREIIAHNRPLIDSIWYWRWEADSPPVGMLARVLGKGEKIERDLRIAAGGVQPPSDGGAFRWLHVDPLTVANRRPAKDDVVIVHDLGPLTHPKLFGPGVGKSYDFAYRILAQSEARLVFVSGDTQRQYCQMYGETPGSQVIYPPVASRLHKGERQRPAGVGSRYLLTVGAIGARKNQARSIAAFAASGLAEDGFEYVLCGSREPGHHKVTALADRTPGVRLLPFVTDAELRWLYANAAGFVLPSLLEGFGMPGVEAMAFGLVPIISRDTVLAEVAGGVALVVDPENVEDIAVAMRQLTAIAPAELAHKQAVMQSSLARCSQENFLAKWREVLGSE
jgi:glycosyltransferase involved in cell wall biosynthesis